MSGETKNNGVMPQWQTINWLTTGKVEPNEDNLKPLCESAPHDLSVRTTLAQLAGLNLMELNGSLNKPRNADGSLTPTALRILEIAVEIHAQGDPVKATILAGVVGVESVVPDAYNELGIAVPPTE